VKVDLHADIRFQKLKIGAEQAPLLVIDNFVADADELVRIAASRPYSPVGPFYPGIRSAAPPEYLQLIITRLARTLGEFFQLQGTGLRFTLCHYSLVTTPAANLNVLQRIPHFDSAERDGLATVHYLFKKDLGGTAFYRHRKTGFELIDEERAPVYFKSLESENDGPNMPQPEYINGDTALFEQIARQDGVFNRMIVYRRNSLHSGCIGREFVPDPNPLTGRLSINSFINFVP
jgi:hypothetical protein